MILLKATRSQQGAYRADSYEDGAAYFALAGESAHRDRAEAAPQDRHPMTPNVISYPAVEIGADVRFDQTGRQEVVEQNGNDGAIYSESGYCLSCRSHRYAHHDANCPLQPKAQSDLAELAIQQGGNCWLPIDEFTDITRLRPQKMYDVKFEAGHIARHVGWQFVCGKMAGAKFYREHVPGETDA